MEETSKAAQNEKMKNSISLFHELKSFSYRKSQIDSMKLSSENEGKVFIRLGIAPHSKSQLYLDKSSFRPNKHDTFTIIMFLLRKKHLHFVRDNGIVVLKDPSTTATANTGNKKLNPEEILFYFIHVYDENDKLVKTQLADMNLTMGEMYARHASADGILYISISKESTLG